MCEFVFMCEICSLNVLCFFYNLFIRVVDRWRCRAICARDKCKLALNISFHILFGCSELFTECEGIVRRVF